MHTWLAMLAQKCWMKGTYLVQARKSMDMRYSRRVRPGPAGKHTCSWCRCFLQLAALTPRSILPGCANPARTAPESDWACHTPDRMQPTCFGSVVHS